MKLRLFLYRILLLFWILSIFTGCSRSYFNEGTAILEEPLLEIPFTMVNGLIVLEGSIHGEPGKFLFDNGFSYSAVSPEYALKTGLTFNKKSNITDANGKKSNVSKVKVDAFHLNSAKFEGTYFLEINTRLFFPCDELDGIIGASIINKLNWKIDYIKESITFSKYKFNYRGEKLPIEFSNNNSAFVDLRVNGEEYRTKVDWGKQHEITLKSEKALLSFKGSQAAVVEGSTTLSANGLGKAITSYNLLDLFSIETNSETLPVNASIELEENLKYEAYMGCGYLKKYQQVIFNALENEIILGDPVVRLEDEDGKNFGIGIYPVSGKWMIIYKYLGNDLLNEANIGDIVVQLDNKPIDRFDDICQLREHLEMNKEKGRPLNIILMNGKRIVSPYSIPVTTLIK